MFKILGGLLIITTVFWTNFSFGAEEIVHQKKRVPVKKNRLMHVPYLKMDYKTIFITKVNEVRDKNSSENSMLFNLFLEEQDIAQRFQHNDNLHGGMSLC